MAARRGGLSAAGHRRPGSPRRRLRSRRHARRRVPRPHHGRERGARGGGRTASGASGGVERLVALAVGAERVAQALPVFRETYARVCAEQTDALPDARPTLEALSVAGLKAAVASNKPVEFTERILATLGLRRYLAAVEGPETAGALKPEPAMLRRCLVALGIEAAGALYVGDMPMDVIAGERAAVRVVLVGGGAAPVRELRATGATVLARLYDLVSMLGLDAPGGKPR